MSQRRPFFTADIHAYHKNVIKYCNRPFKDMNEMLERIEVNWNDKITAKDQVWILGDFAFCGREFARGLLKRLNGHKHLVIGNHDDKRILKAPEWESVQNYKEINVGKQHIVLFHYGMRVWSRSHYGSWMLYGHSHGSLPPIRNSFDVGIDSHNFTPLHYDEVEDIIKNQDVKSIKSDNLAWWETYNL